MTGKRTLGGKEQEKPGYQLSWDQRQAKGPIPRLVGGWRALATEGRMREKADLIGRQIIGSFQGAERRAWWTQVIRRWPRCEVGSGGSDPSILPFLRGL